MMKYMFRIKICGVKNVNDACAAVDAGADALGLNFYDKSKRRVDPDVASQIASSVPNSIPKVGVFVNHSTDQIQDIAAQIHPSHIQLHGDESPQFLNNLPLSIKIIRAYRCGAAGLAPLASYIEECRALGRVPDAVLIDADAGTSYGGTGQAADWALIVKHRHALGEIPLILAGGLTPTNVAAAIEAVRPDAVDVASGVERAPGIKDHDLIKQFIADARKAFDRI
jgi:phosphoribosylanthranilate isomerase